MDSHLSLATVKPIHMAQNGEVIGYLEKLLGQAKEGKILSLCCVFSGPDGSEHGWRIAGGRQDTSLLGEVHLMHSDMTDMFLSADRDSTIGALYFD